MRARKESSHGTQNSEMVVSSPSVKTAKFTLSSGVNTENTEASSKVYVHNGGQERATMRKRTLRGEDPNQNSQMTEVRDGQKKSKGRESPWQLKHKRKN